MRIRRVVRPPDPILSLTPEERAYLAGLIDGEGCIYVAAIGPKRDRTEAEGAAHARTAARRRTFFGKP